MIDAVTVHVGSGANLPGYPTYQPNYFRVQRHSGRIRSAKLYPSLVRTAYDGKTFSSRGSDSPN
jgi:hypothetical protein